MLKNPDGFRDIRKLPVTICFPSLCQFRHKIRPSCLSSTLSKSKPLIPPTRNRETYPMLRKGK